MPAGFLLLVEEVIVIPPIHIVPSERVKLMESLPEAGVVLLNVVF